MSDFGAYAVEYGPAVIGGITQLSEPTNTQTTSDESGDLYDNIRAVSQQSPVINFTTKSIGTTLALVPQQGQCISATPLVAWARQKEDCSNAPLGTNSHTKYTIPLGLIIPVSLSAQRGEDVTLQLEARGITDGTNAPLAISHGNALPSTPTVELFTLGAVKVADILFTDVRSVDLQFGIETGEIEPELGGIWPDTVSVRKVRPVATITGRNPTRVTNDGSAGSSIAMTGSVAGHGTPATPVYDTVFFFKKRKNRASFEANDASVHLKITMAGLTYPDNLFNASGESPGETTITLEGIHDGTNTPLLITTSYEYDPAP